MQAPGPNTIQSNPTHPIFGIHPIRSKHKPPTHPSHLDIQNGTRPTISAIPIPRASHQSNPPYFNSQVRNTLPRSHSPRPPNPQSAMINHPPPMMPSLTLARFPLPGSKSSPSSDSDSQAKSGRPSGYVRPISSPLTHKPSKKNSIQSRLTDLPSYVPPAAAAAHGIHLL